MKIGYLNNDYPNIRCIIEKVSGGGYIHLNRKFDVDYDIAVGLAKCRKEKIDWALNYHPIFEPRVDLVHTFNSICNIKGNWCATFESTIPRTKITKDRPWENTDQKFIPDQKTLVGLRLLAKRNCIALLALSESAYRIQKYMLQQLESSVDKAAILNKMTVCHPPQKIFLETAELEKKYADISDKIYFLFIGNDFFRKGGAEMIDALSKYKKECNFHLTVVSSLSYGDYASKSTIEEKKYYQQILEGSDWITWYKHLANEDVIDLCLKSHVGLLPTLADTYGYSVLEMQACGCPVITSNVRAMPEINNKETGWICTLPIDNIGGEAVFHSYPDLQICRDLLKKQLESILETIFSDIGAIKAKAKGSLERVGCTNNPEIYGERLNEIYRMGLKGGI